ncbi:hypothetical protein ACJRO7_016606 [Eucalyptus globulus]|uniref:Fe2OG dioxygenase domain-containing protein n=1 Tax=Eucalyptus globulus TaxID=34317 RepID=A0ABD3LB71_EUCGL
MVCETDSDVPVTFPKIDISLLSSEDELQKLSSIQLLWMLPGFYLSSNQVEGYGSDLVMTENRIRDCCYRLFLRVFPEDQRRLNLWPENPSDFSEILHEYTPKVKLMINHLSKAMARSLKLEETSFLNQFGDLPVMQVRFNFYPPSSRTEVFGVKPHSDRSGITVLLQDREVEGLQVLKDGAWYTVPVIPDALVVNLGDQMQIMTNGIMTNGILTNANKLRLLFALFSEPEAEKEIGPVDCLIDETRSRLYRNVRNFAAFNYECFQKGKVALEEVRI